MLVRRHGGMVFGVCRRVLNNTTDADDAFQATFLVFVQKGRTLNRPEQVAGWLHAVALRVARKLRATRARRREREAVNVDTVDPPDSANSDPASESQVLRRTIDEELDRLPEKYRLPIVLCELEGRSLEEAARLLGWPKGTVAEAPVPWSGTASAATLPPRDRSAVLSGCSRSGARVLRALGTARLGDPFHRGRWIEDRHYRHGTGRAGDLAGRASPRARSVHFAPGHDHVAGRTRSVRRPGAGPVEPVSTSRHCERMSRSHFINSVCFIFPPQTGFIFLTEVDGRAVTGVGPDRTIHLGFLFSPSNRTARSAAR